MMFYRGESSITHCILIWLLIFNPFSKAENQKALIVARRIFDHYEFSFMNANELTVDFPTIAVALHENEINKTGWSTLSVVTAESYPETYQAYWAGFLETNITYDLTKASWMNTVEGICPEPLSKDCWRLHQWLCDNIEYMVHNFLYRGFGDEFWYQVGLQLWQLKGMSDAYNGLFVTNSSKLIPDYLRTLQDEVFGLYLLQLSGDLSELITALQLETLKEKCTAYRVHWTDHQSCSALIKLIPGDVLLSHVTWSPYATMLRVLKYYRFPWRIRNRDGRLVPVEAISFSSYPSVLSSIDDFYVTSARLVTIETTIGNDNPDLWKFVRNGAQSSVLSPFRVMAANRLATTGQKWVDYFRMENSGTYNNQWMIFNANLFHPEERLPSEGLLTLVEQLPGIVVYDDLTRLLTYQTYWPSYNLPYFPLIYNLSGTADKAAKYGDWYSYEKTARANIFRRDHTKVSDLFTMHNLMRSNDFTKDPFSRCNCSPPYTAENAISARSDLNDPNGTYPLSAFAYRTHGGTDAKITNYAMIQTMNFMATSGPTYSSVPAFQWSKLPVPAKKPHLHPDLWMFKSYVTNFSVPLNGIMMPTSSLIPAF